MTQTICKRAESAGTTAHFGRAPAPCHGEGMNSPPGRPLQIRIQPPDDYPARIRMLQRAVWIQAFVVLVVVAWIASLHVELTSHDRKLRRVADHVTALRRRLKYNQQTTRHCRCPQEDHKLGGPGVIPESSHDVIVTRTRRAGRHPSVKDDKAELASVSAKEKRRASLKRENIKNCPPSQNWKGAEVSCQKSYKLVADVKRFLNTLTARCNAMISRQAAYMHHPSIHLAAIERNDARSPYLSWDTTNPTSHVTTGDGLVTGRDPAYVVDGTGTLVNVTQGGRHVVYAQVTFTGRRTNKKDTLETLDCGFRIVIARSIRYDDETIGLFSSQTTQYEVGPGIYAQDGAYVSGVYAFQPGDELAIDVDRGVNVADQCRINYDPAKTFFGIILLGRSHP